MAYLDYVRTENVLKDFYRKLLDYTTEEVVVKTRKAVSDLEAAPIQDYLVGKDVLKGHMIPVATLYTRHLPCVVKNGVEWKVRRESWISIYSDKTWTGLITASHDILSAPAHDEIAEDVQYVFTTERDIDGVFETKH